MQVKILSTCTELPSDLKIFVLSIFEWSLKTGFTVDLVNLYILRIQLIQARLIP